MNHFYRYRATLGEIEAISELSDDDALKISRDLALTHIALTAYCGITDNNVGAAAREVGIKIMSEIVEEPQEYILAPYIIEGEPVIRGVALWQSLADYNRHRI